MNYKVIYPIDSLDPLPTIKIFETQFEAEEWLHDEVQKRIDFTVQHSDFCLNDREYKAIEEYEYSLVRIEEILL